MVYVCYGDWLQRSKVPQSLDPPQAGHSVHANQPVESVQPRESGQAVQSIEASQGPPPVGGGGRAAARKAAAGCDGLAVACPGAPGMVNGTQRISECVLCLFAGASVACALFLNVNIQCWGI